jgi:hypothetical protein
LPQLTVYLYILTDVGEWTEDTATYNLSTLDAVLLYYVVGIPDGGSESVIVAVRNEEVLSAVDLGVLIVSEANVSSLLSVFLLLLLGKVGSLHLLDGIIRSLSLFSNEEGAVDNIFEGVTLPMADTLITCEVISNDKTIGADETEDTCHNTEGGSTIVRVDDNNLRTLIGGGESIEEVTVREANTVLREGSLLTRLALGESISYLIALSTESVNDVGSGELTVLLSTSGGVVGLEHLRATSSDFGIGECEHVFVSFYLLEVSVLFGWLTMSTRTLYTIFEF